MLSLTIQEFLATHSATELEWLRSFASQHNVEWEQFVREVYELEQSQHADLLPSQ